MAGRKEMDLTTGRPFGSLLKFATPVILGNLFQLFYTMADSVIVGKTLGADSLAAVGSTSIIIYFVLCAFPSDHTLDENSGRYCSGGICIYVCRASRYRCDRILQYDLQYTACTGRQ